MEQIDCNCTVTIVVNLNDNFTHTDRQGARRQQALIYIIRQFLCENAWKFAV